MDLEYTAPDGATFYVAQNGKAFPPSYETAVSWKRLQPTAFRVAPTTEPVRLSVQWDFPTSPQDFTVRVTSFTTLNIVAVWLYGNQPSVTDPGTKPVLVALGDSIIFGAFSGGPQAGSSGYADWLTNRWNVRNWAVPGSSATCTGQHLIDEITPERPAAVLVAYGTNDITGEYGGCRGTLNDFRKAMSSIVEQLHADIPGAAIYLASILPRYDGHGNAVPKWNRVVHEVADQYSVPFVDTTAVLTQSDFVDGLHPSAAGHGKLAQFWHRVFADVSAPAVPSVSISPRPFSASLGLSPTWSSSDAGTGVQGYDVRYRVARYDSGFGAFTPWWDRTPAMGAALGGLPGRTYCFSALAFDRAGNASAWAPQRCVATPLDDRSLERRGGWEGGTGSGYFQGTFLRGSGNGAKVWLNGVRGRRIAILATTCPTCGRLAIRWDGQTVATLDLRSATTVRSAVIPAFSHATGDAGTFAVRITSSGRPVTVDGVAILH